MKKNKINDQLRDLGIQEGDTVMLYGWAFEWIE